MSRDWERNFSSTMKETEENLNRIRTRLDPARYKPIEGGLLDSPPSLPEAGDQLDNGVPKIRMKSSLKSSIRKERPVSAVFAGSSPSYELYRHSTPSTGLVALLSEKVERQNKMIEQLSHQMQDLENERRRNEVKVADLEHQVNTLNSRLSEGRGQYSTDPNIDSWQRDVRNRLDEMNGRITRHLMGGAGEPVQSEGAIVSIRQDLLDMKRSLQTEYDSLHREIETLRTRLVKQEMDVSGQGMACKEMSRRMDRLDRKLGQVSSDQQQVLSQHLGLTPRAPQSPPPPPAPQVYNTQKDIRDLKMEMSRLLSSFSKLESASQVSRTSTRSDPSTVSSTTVSSRGSRHQRSYPSSISSTKGPTVVSSSWQRVPHHHHHHHRGGAVSSSSSDRLRRKKKKTTTKTGTGTSGIDIEGSSTSLEDLSSSEMSLPLSISHEGEEYGDEEEEERRKNGGRGGRDGGNGTSLSLNSGDIDDENDDISLLLSDLEISQKDGEFGSAISLDSDQLDLDFL